MLILFAINLLLTGVLGALSLGTILDRRENRKHWSKEQAPAEAAAMFFVIYALIIHIGIGIFLWGKL